MGLTPLKMPTSSSPAPRPFIRLFSGRFGGIGLFLILFVAVSLATRVALLVKSAPSVSWDASLFAVFAWGLAFDLGAASFAALPLIFLLVLLPSGWFLRSWHHVVAHAVGILTATALAFGIVSEWVFWDEFNVRFNFIAVDYLVYTKEVVANIRESYPMPLIIGGIVIAGIGMHMLICRTRWPRRWLQSPSITFGRRLAFGAVAFAVALTYGVALNSTQLPAFANNYNRELAKNGLWSLFAAFRNNELDYKQFYATDSDDEAFARIRIELVEDGSLLLEPGKFDTLRYVHNEGPEKRPNVIQITVESLSADFLSIFNRASGLTPNLTVLAEHSLVFENFYATGTRTDRGMEALTLSLPPTPGRSMIKRPRNEGMFTLGSVFRAKGYDTAFIYGGFGYFDNMNHFFGNNGYRVVDRNSVESSDITFANAWGACDEDLYNWTLREADKSHAAGKPFHYFVMTTSNHRPYTYPDGKIDLPSKVSGRAGAVKYTDYAIGKLLRDAATKPWFKDTVFVIVADHCASVAGRTALPIENYHIPLFIFAPGGHIAPGKIKILTSQIDYAPTLLGLLNWSYPSRFFGHDVRKIPEEDAHALVGNYQKLGHLEKGQFQVLSPLQGESIQRFDVSKGTYSETTPSSYAEHETIAFYQTASYLYQNDLYKELTKEEFDRYSNQGRQLATHTASNPVTK